MPKVLNAHGTGWTADTLPEGSVYVGGWAWPIRISSKWRNRYKVGRDGTRDEVVEKFEHSILGNPDLLAALPELRGRDLVCWCAPERCHANVLIELANR